MTSKSDNEEPFVSRWSRLKREARERAPQQPAEERAAGKGPGPDLPPLEKLTFESDYRPFFHPKVGEEVRRAALKKLFSDPRFNVMDGPEVHIEDFSASVPIPAAMLARLEQAQKMLDWAKGEEPARGGKSGNEGGEQRAPESRAVTDESARSEPVPEAEKPVHNTAGIPDGAKRA
jgi:hypothetical protein